MCHANNMSLWEAPKNFYIENKICKLAAQRDIRFPIFKVPNKHFKAIMSIFKRFTPDLLNFDNILKYPDVNDSKGIVLDSSKLLNISNELTEKEVKILKNLNYEYSEDKIEYYNKIISYDNYRFSTLVEWIIPKECQLSGFTIVGHIVHINLKEELNSFKYAIGELLLDKVPHAKCVVSKINKIDSEFRTFELDLLAGEPNYVTTIKENGFEFSFDFSKVYWNSRLGTEHCRITTFFQAKDVVYDACAGVGPFAIPAAKKGCRVIANDLNSESCKWFKENVKTNSTRRNKFSIDLHNLDASEFIQKIMLPDIFQYSSNTNESTRFFLIMNLPSIAVDFLSSINDSEQLAKITKENVSLHVRCYCFIGKETPREIIEEKIQRQLGDRIESLNLRMVRNVAPAKDMYCAEISVNLSSATVSSDNESSAKRLKLN